jgi:hypothetical protein
MFVNRVPGTILRVQVVVTPEEHKLILNGGHRTNRWFVQRLGGVVIARHRKHRNMETKIVYLDIQKESEGDDTD